MDRPGLQAHHDGSSPTEQSISIVRGLQDVTVMEPAPAWFECETSIPSVRPPKWLLGKTVLQAGANVGLEQEGTVHRLTLRRTCCTMTGPVHFTIGKSRSSARLVVSGELRWAPLGTCSGPGSGGARAWPGLTGVGVWGYTGQRAGRVPVGGEAWCRQEGVWVVGGPGSVVGWGKGRGWCRVGPEVRGPQSRGQVMGKGRAGVGGPGHAWVGVWGGTGWGQGGHVEHGVGGGSEEQGRAWTQQCG